MRSVKGFCLCLGLVVAAAARAADFNMDVLSEFVRTREVQTLEQALAVLPAELRANYALVFASRSLQDAAPAAPRAILYGADGRFIVSFNGDADERGYDVLETMQFDERSNSFHFREVSFQGAGESAKAEHEPRCHEPRCPVARVGRQGVERLVERVDQHCARPDGEDEVKDPVELVAPRPPDSEYSSSP